MNSPTYILKAIDTNILQLIHFDMTKLHYVHYLISHIQQYQYEFPTLQEVIVVLYAVQDFRLEAILDLHLSCYEFFVVLIFQQVQLGVDLTDETN